MSARETARTEAGDALTRYRPANLPAQWAVPGRGRKACPLRGAHRGLVAGARGGTGGASIARVMGLTRQSVQRGADLLVGHGLAEYSPNPAHRRAKLLRPTVAGHSAVGSLALAQHDWANRVADGIEVAELPRTRDIIDRILLATERVDEDGDSALPVSVVSLERTAAPGGGRKGL